MATISSVTKVGNLLEITYSDGVVTRQSIVFADVVTSVPPSGSIKVGVVYVNGSGQFVIQYNGSTITLGEGSALTGAEIVVLLEALDSGSRLSHGKLDDVGTGDHHTKYTDVSAKAAAVLAGAITDGETKAPTHDAIKEYVDTLFANLYWHYLLSNTASGIGSYYTMALLPTGEVESTFTSGSLGVADDQALFQWISEDAVLFNTVQTGSIEFHIHAERTVGNRTVNLYAELYEYKADTSEVLIATTEVSGAVTSKAAVQVHALLTPDYEMSADSKLLIKWFANVSGGGANVTIALYCEGANTSGIEAAISQDALEDIFVKLSTYNANTILAATSDDTPVALTVGEQTLVGRITSGNIAALTVAQIRTLLGLGSAAYTTATAYVTHALATAANDFLVASGSGAYVKKTLAETLALISPLTTRGDIMFRNATVSTRLAKGTEGYVLTMGVSDPAWAAAGGGGIKVKLETRDFAAASGTVSYTGYGFQPTGLLISAGGKERGSFGSSEPALAENVFYEMNVAKDFTTDEESIIWVYDGTNNQYQKARVTAYNEDGFSLIWTKSGTPTGTIVFHVFAFR